MPLLDTTALEAPQTASLVSAWFRLASHAPKVTYAMTVLSSQNV